MCFPGAIQNMLRLKCAECLYIYEYIHIYTHIHTCIYTHIWMHTATRKLFYQEKLIIKALVEISGK